MAQAKIIRDYSASTGLTAAQRYRAAVDAAGTTDIELWEALLPSADSDGFFRNEFWMPLGSTEAQARYQAWQVWSLARCGSNVQPTLQLCLVAEETRAAA